MIVTVVGAGGKTTVCLRLGAELAAIGFKVLYATTTHILLQKELPVFIGDPRDIVPQGNFMSAARDKAEGDKLKGFTGPDIDLIAQKQIFDVVIVEGDGAKGRPVKAPAEWEPVYPQNTKTVIGVIGLDCIGKPITDEYVHRSELFCKVTGSTFGEKITCEYLRQLIQSPQGLFRHAPEAAQKIVFLNKADLLGKNKEQALSLLRSADFPVLLTSQENDWPNDFIQKFILGTKG